MQAYETGEIIEPRPLKFDEVEGTDLNTISEPIWRSRPVASGKRSIRSRRQRKFLPQTGVTGNGTRRCRIASYRTGP
jgi:hypothetical protein